MTTVTMIAVQAELTSRWAIGALASAADAVKLPIAMDPRSGAPVIPGSSLAGSLRQHLGADAADWLGQDPDDFEESTGNKARKPSRLALLGSRVEASTHTAGSTRIDPLRGAAAGTGLRHYEWANATPTVMIAFQHEGPGDDVLIERLYGWPLYLGRSRSTGLGEARVVKVHTLTLDLSSEGELSFWLGPRADWFDAPGEAGVGVYKCPDRQPLVSSWAVVALRTKEPLAIGDGESRREGDGRAREVVRLTPQGRPFIPGSSWRGMFRHRMHTILGAIGATESECTEILEGLFGSTDRGRGPLWFGDSALPDHCVTRSHVAIDRFTGGAHQGLLFKVKAVRPGTEIEFRYRWEHGQIPSAVENLVRHVVRDLHDGLTSVGGMGTRGYGWVTLRDNSVPQAGLVVIDDLIQAVVSIKPGTSVGVVTGGSEQ